MNGQTTLERKVIKDIKAGLSFDRIIGRNANKRNTNNDEIRRIIQRYKWNEWKSKL